MWPSHAHVLQPLTDASGLKKWQQIKWTDEMEKAYKKIKSLMTADALLSYHDHSRKYHIYNDASDFQLGACIMQH